MAIRIQARAIRRCGELLRKIEPKPGARTDLPGIAGNTRFKAAADAGMSKRQRDTALRVAKVNGKDFERQVESAPDALMRLRGALWVADYGRQVCRPETVT
jgi:hypothetical protein